MKTIKIIDLAEKQKNNEILPKHIRYENKDLYFDGVTYYDEEGNNDFFDILAMNNNALTHLYDEVEIIEEKPKHIEEINKSYPIFNFDEKSFEAMKDMLQDVYSKQVKIIKALNYLLDKEQNER